MISKSDITLRKNSELYYFGKGCMFSSKEEAIPVLKQVQKSLESLWLSKNFSIVSSQINQIGSALQVTIDIQISK